MVVGESGGVGYKGNMGLRGIKDTGELYVIFLSRLGHSTFLCFVTNVSERAVELTV